MFDSVHAFNRDRTSPRHGSKHGDRERAACPLIADQLLFSFRKNCGSHIPFRDQPRTPWSRYIDIESIYFERVVIGLALDLYIPFLTSYRDCHVLPVLLSKDLAFTPRRPI